MAEVIELERRRELAHFVPILEERRARAGEVNCAGCDHLGDFNDEHRRGYCMELRSMRSTWHPVQCAAFVPLARERRVKVVWQGVSYG